MASGVAASLPILAAIAPRPGSTVPISKPQRRVTDSKTVNSHRFRRATPLNTRRSILMTSNLRSSVLLRQRRSSNFNPPRQGCCSHRRSYFQYAVLILGCELFCVHALRQREGPLKHSVGNLLVEEIHVLRAAVHFALAANRESVPLSVDLHFLGINPGKRDTAGVLFT